MKTIEKHQAREFLRQRNTVDYGRARKGATGLGGKSQRPSRWGCGRYRRNGQMPRCLTRVACAPASPQERNLTGSGRACTVYFGDWRAKPNVSWRRASDASDAKSTPPHCATCASRQARQSPQARVPMRSTIGSWCQVDPRFGPAWPRALGPWDTKRRVALTSEASAKRLRLRPIEP